MNSLCKTILQIKLSYWLKALSPGKTEQRECRAEFLTLTVLLTNGLCKTIFWAILSYKLIKALFPREPEEWICRVHPYVTNKWPWQDHILSKTISWKTLSPGRPEQWIWSLLQCHWETAFSRPSFEQYYHINSSKLCFPGNLKNEYAESTPV